MWLEVTVPCVRVFVLQRHSIGTTSVQYAHWFLKEMSEEVNQVITAICEEQCMLADKVSTLCPCPPETMILIFLHCRGFVSSVV